MVQLIRRGADARFQGYEIDWEEAGSKLVAVAESQLWAIAVQASGGGADLEAETLNTGWPLGDLEKTDQIVNV